MDDGSRPLPPGWQRYRSRSTQQVYYFDTRSGTSQFHFPEEQASPVWVLHRSERTGEPFFFNRVTQEVSWTNPEEDLDSALSPEEAAGVAANMQKWGKFEPFSLSGFKNTGVNGRYYPNFDWQYEEPDPLNGHKRYTAVIFKNKDSDQSNPTIIYWHFVKQHWAVTPLYWEQQNLANEVIFRHHSLSEDSKGVAFFSTNRDRWYEWNDAFCRWEKLERWQIHWSENPSISIPVQSGPLQLPKNMPNLRTPVHTGFTTPLPWQAGVKTPIPGMQTPAQRAQQGMIRKAPQQGNLPGTPGAPRQTLPGTPGGPKRTHAAVSGWVECQGGSKAPSTAADDNSFENLLEEAGNKQDDSLSLVVREGGPPVEDPAADDASLFQDTEDEAPDEEAAEEFQTQEEEEEEEEEDLHEYAGAAVPQTPELSEPVVTFRADSEELLPMIRDSVMPKTPELCERDVYSATPQTPERAESSTKRRKLGFASRSSSEAIHAEPSQPMQVRCAHPGCAYLRHTDPSISETFCCKKCAESKEKGRDPVHGKKCERKNAPPEDWFSAPTVIVRPSRAPGLQP